MDLNWSVVSVDEIKAPTKLSIAIGPFGSRMKSDCYVDDGVPVIRGNNLSHSKSFVGDFVFISSEKADELASSNVFAGDLVFPHRGNIGEVGIVPSDKPRYVLSTSLMKLTVDQKKVDPLFLFYFFRSPIGRYELLKNASQVGTPGIATPLASLKSVQIKLPSLSEQRAIAYILSTIDDKIELNHKMNQTLEAIAQAIFKAWFVDFDPVKAKSSSESTDSICHRLGLTPEILALFPDSFEDSPLGEIPKGWQWTTFGEVIEIFDSKRIPLSNKERLTRVGKYPYYGATSIMDYIDDYLFDGIYLLVGEDGSVVDSEGYPVIQYVWGRFWVNNHAHVLKAKSPISDENLLLAFKNKYITPYVTGAVQLKLNQKNLKSISFLKADDAIHIKFTSIISPLYDMYRGLANEIKTLTALRDFLLPKLFSGDIPIKE